MYSSMEEPVRQTNPGPAEQDFELRAQTMREKYEERLAGMTEKIRSILDDIKQDEVIATMQEDPASAPFIKARMRELAEDRLGQEREETINKLVKELAFLHSENQRLDRDCSQARSVTRSLEEQVRQERSRADFSERESKDLRAKAATSERQFQESVRKFADESADELKQAKIDAEKLKEQLEQSERGLWVKSSEIEMLKQELEAEKARGSKFLVDQSSLKRAYQALQEDYEKMTVSLQSSSGGSSDLQQKLTFAKDEIASLESTIKSYERERVELQQKYLSFGQEFKEALESEHKSAAEIIIDLQKKHKEKCSRFKKKIIEQKGKIKGLETETEELRTDLEGTRTSYEHSIELMQEDLRKVRDEWDLKCQEIDTAANKRLSDQQSKHQSQLSLLQKQCQSLLDEKIKEMQEESAHQTAKQRQAEADLKRLLDEKVMAVDKEYIRISKHESILSDESARFRTQLSQEKRVFEEEITADFSKKLNSLKEDHNTELQRLIGKLRSAEESQESAESGKRKTDRELEYANERIELLNGKLANLTTDLTEMEANKKSVLRHLEDAGINLAKLKGMYEDESVRRKAVEEQLGIIKDKAKVLETQLNQKEADFQQQIHLLKLQNIEETTKMQESLEREQALSKKQLIEIQKLRETLDSLQREKAELHENHIKTSEDLKQNSIKIKREGMSMYEEEVAAHQETQARLSDLENDLTHLTADLQALRTDLQDEKDRNSLLERESESLQSLLESISAENGSLKIDQKRLLSSNEKRKASFDAFKSRARKAIKDLAQQYQIQLSQVQRALSSDLTEFKKFLSRQVAESISGVEEIQLKQRRTYSLSLLSKEDQLRAAEKEKSRLEQDLTATFESKSRGYETHIDSLKSSLNQLRTEVSDKSSEITSFLQKISDFQQEQTHLREENRSLQGELQNATRELEYSKLESQEVQTRLKTSFEEEIIGRETSWSESHKEQLSKLEEIVADLRTRNEASLGRFQEEVRNLQEKHRREMEGLETSYGRRVADLERAGQNGERQKQRLMSELEDLENEIGTVKTDYGQQLALLEDDLGELLVNIRTDQEKYAQFRSEKVAEIEDFSRRLKATTRELQEKDETLEKTNRDKEILRNQLRDIRESQTQKEISDLRGNLEKSMNSTAQELRKARGSEVGKNDEDPVSERPIEVRKVSQSLSQLKASLEKYS